MYTLMDTSGVRLKTALNAFLKKPVIETFTKSITDWVADGSIAPWNYKTSLTLTYALTENTVIDITTDETTLSAVTTGITGGSINGQVITLFSLIKPIAPIQVKCAMTEVD